MKKIFIVFSFLYAAVSYTQEADIISEKTFFTENIKEFTPNVYTTYCPRKFKNQVYGTMLSKIDLNALFLT
ncbi:MAG: hypothetical protein COB98_03270 [Flavobacteriaceae bacterium]|nr:MAG: hypothetical protein COB98_03270 [Flavobacteriaceae bacterium]